MNRAITWFAATALIILALLLWLQGSMEAATALYALIGVLIMAIIGRRMTTAADARWLPAAISLAYVAKLMASSARFSVLEFVYGGSGDASGYQGAGIVLVHTWRGFEVPALGIGTRTVDVVTGLLYVPYVPTKLGGFILFATIAFFGQLLLYAAFRISAKPSMLRWYAAALLFLPTIVYWPSSIGKESLMFLFIGTAAYGAAALLKDYRLRWALIFGLGTSGSAAIRPHIALLLVIALVFALIISKSATRRRTLGRRAILLIVVGAFAFVVIAATTVKFGIDFTQGLDATVDIQNLLDEVQGNTNQGGSSVVGSVIKSPLDFPTGAIKVLFRPFPQETTNIQALASSIEGMLLLGIFAWRFLPMLRNARRVREEPYLLFSLAFTVGFVIAFSTFNNFGLLARQRSQVMPFFIALVIALGWAWVADDEDESLQHTSPKARKRAAR